MLRGCAIPHFGRWNVPPLHRRGGAVCVRFSSVAPPDRRVLCLYVGGTIGMSMTPAGFAPERGLLTHILRNNPKFHDSNLPCPPSGGVMPVSQWGKRVHWTVDEAETLLDSTNMNPSDWVDIANKVFSNYHKYDGFVLIQGTDTLAYTASALSFMFSYLAKSVIITGSQVPLAVQPNDAEANLFGSINIAGHFEIPEVCVFFNGWLTRGNRTTKFDAMSYKAFMSHNYPPLGEFHAKVEINWALVRTAAEVEHRSHPFQVKRLLTEGVAVLRMFPGISAHFVRKCLEAPLRGCVLTTFGQGNVYSREPGILQAIEEAAARGLLIVNVTQCPRGTVTASYVTGRVLTNIGVESGHDMTVESALAKMGFLLSEVDAGTYTHEQARAMLSKPLRGELTSPVEVQQFSFRDQNFVQAFAQSMEKMIAPGSDSLSGRLQGIASALFGVVSQYGDVPAMESVWRSGANVDAVDGDGRTALHTSVIRKRLDVVRFLVDVAKCDLNIVDETPGFGLTPLDHALIHGSMEIAEYLRNKGALQAYMIKK